MVGMDRLSRFRILNMHWNQIISNWLKYFEAPNRPYGVLCLDCDGWKGLNRNEALTFAPSNRSKHAANGVGRAFALAATDVQMSHHTKHIRVKPQD